MTKSYPRMARLKNADLFRNHIENLGINLPFDEELLSGPESPMAMPLTLSDGRVIGNRFCTSPMEGWDGTSDGRPTEYTTRRWRNFGRSGAKLIWGGEAFAVQADGRVDLQRIGRNVGINLAVPPDVPLHAHACRSSSSMMKLPEESSNPVAKG